MTSRGLLIFRMITAWVTLALVVFVLWISDGSMLGRLIAGGVVMVGALQWYALRRMSYQMAAALEPEVEEGDETG